MSVFVRALGLCLVLASAAQAATPSPFTGQVVRVNALEGIPFDRQALLLLRVLALDTQLPTRARPTLRVAVVFRPGDAESTNQKDQFIQSLRTFAQRSRVAGRDVEVVELPFEGDQQFGPRLAELGAGAAYLCGGLEDAVPAIIRETRAKQTLTFATEERYVELGVSVGLIRRTARVAILLNKGAAEAEGAVPDPALLAVAEVVP